MENRWRDLFYTWEGFTEEMAFDQIWCQIFTGGSRKAGLDGRNKKSKGTEDKGQAYPGNSGEEPPSYSPNI